MEFYVINDVNTGQMVDQLLKWATSDSSVIIKKHFFMFKSNKQPQRLSSHKIHQAPNEMSDINARS